MLQNKETGFLIKITMYMYALSSIINIPHRNGEFLWINGSTGFTSIEQKVQYMVFMYIYTQAPL